MKSVIQIASMVLSSENSMTVVRPRLKIGVSCAFARPAIGQHGPIAAQTAN